MGTIVGRPAFVDTDELPEATRGDGRHRPGADVRNAFRAATLLLAGILVTLMMRRGYGIDPAVGASAETARRQSGEWVSVPWRYVSAKSPQELQLAVDPSACARVVRYEVTETPTAVLVTVWRRRVHPSCTALAIVVRLDAPLGGRGLVDGGVLSLR